MKRERLALVISWSLALLFLFSSWIPHRYVVGGSLWIDGLLGFASTICLVICAGLAVLTRPNRFPISLPVLAWLSIELLGGLGSEVPSLGLIRFLYYALSGVVVCWIVWSVRWTEHVETVLVVGLIAGISVSVYGICEFAMGENPIWGPTFSLSNPKYAQFASDEFGRRILSSVGHPVYLGTFLALLIPMALHAGMTASPALRPLGWAAAATMMAALLLTFTRGAYAATFVAGIVYLRRHTAGRLIRVLALAGVVVAVAFSSDRVWETLAGRQTVSQLQRFMTDQRGVAYWQASALMLDSPLLGVGTGHYRYTAKRYRDYNDTPDNMYLRVLAENGAAGFASFAYLLYAILIHLKSRRDHTGNPQIGDLQSAIYASVFGFLVDLVTCDALHFPLTRFTFWTLVGFGLSLSGQRQVIPEGRR